MKLRTTSFMGIIADYLYGLLKSFGDLWSEEIPDNDNGDDQVDECAGLNEPGKSIADIQDNSETVEYKGKYAPPAIELQQPHADKHLKRGLDRHDIQGCSVRNVVEQRKHEAYRV